MDTTIDELLAEFDSKARDIKSLVDTLVVQLGKKSVPKEFKDKIDAFYDSIKSYGQTAETAIFDTICHSATMVAVYGQSIAQLIPTTLPSDSSALQIGEELLQKSISFRSFIEKHPATFRTLEEIDKYANETFDYQKLKSDIKSTIEEQERHDIRIKKSLNESESKITLLDEKLKQLEIAATEETNKISATYEKAVADTKIKQQQIDELLGHASGRVIAGDYEKSASEEKFMADTLRLGSLACMIIVTVLLGFTFWETTEADFQWQKSLFRIALTFLISVPAAYLARESAKHRQQQYQHLQTSLDLKALSPFAASLPEEQQHKLKMDIAGRVFSVRDFSKVGVDSYPINTQELLMELFKKFDIQKPEKEK